MTSARAQHSHAAELRALDLTPQGLETTCALLRRVWPAAGHLTPRYLDWLYNRNPVGPAFGTNAVRPDGALVAHYPLVPVRTWLHGERKPGLIAFNLCVAPELRGGGLFRAVADRSHEEALARGHDHFYGVTNAMSAPIYESWGVQLVAPLDVKVGLGPAPPRRDEGRREFVRIWDEDTLAWRLADPERRYRVELRGEESAVLAPAGRFGLQVEMGRFPTGALPATLERIRVRGPRLWMGLDASRAWRGRLYADLPRRLRPVPLVLTFFDLERRGRTLDAGRTRFDALDFDAF